MAKVAAGTPKARGKTGTRASAGTAARSPLGKDTPAPLEARRGKAAAAPAEKAPEARAKGGSTKAAGVKSPAAGRAATKAPARPTGGATSKRAATPAKAGAPSRVGQAKAPVKASAASKAAKGGATIDVAGPPAGRDGEGEPDGKEGGEVEGTGAASVVTGRLRRRGALRSASIPLPEPPKKPPTPLPAATLAKLRRLLEEERATYLRQADELAAEAEALTAEREPGDTQFDEESGEGDTIAVERERDLALSASARQAVEEIDRAIARMDGGSFGYCTSCGNKIPMARLEALPYAALCIPCKSREERRR